MGKHLPGTRILDLGLGEACGDQTVISQERSFRIRAKHIQPRRNYLALVFILDGIPWLLSLSSKPVPGTVCPEILA